MRERFPLSPRRLTEEFGPFGPHFALVHAPAAPPDVVEEAWVVRARPLGPSGRVVVEARSHRRGPWLANPKDWPEDVRVLARAEYDTRGRAVSRRPHAQWLSLSGARMRARRVVEVALRAMRALYAPAVAWIEATVDTAIGVIQARIRVDAPLPERRAFLAWAAAHTPHRVSRASFDGPRA